MVLSLATEIEGLVGWREIVPAMIVETATNTEEGEEGEKYFVVATDLPFTFTFQWFVTK